MMRKCLNDGNDDEKDDVSDNDDDIKNIFLPTSLLIGLGVN